MPYESEALQHARKKLVELDDVGSGNLPPTDEARPLSAVLRRKDLLDLFNTDPDLSGFDVDVSDYIRDKGAPGLQVFWRNFEQDPNKPEAQPPPQRDELCPVSLGQAENINKGKSRAWYWNSLNRQWQSLSSAPRPGMTLLLAAADGGYDATLGFINDGTQAKKPVSLVERENDDQHGGYGDDGRSHAKTPCC